MRLIDADKEWSADASNNTGYRIEYKHGIMSLYSPEGDALCEFMPDNPIAYDVDKVVEQVDKYKLVMVTADCPHRYFKAISANKIKDVIKAGGVTEDLGHEYRG